MPGNTPTKKALIVQARLESTRMPNKIIAEIGPGISILDILLSRIEVAVKSRILDVDAVIMAIPNASSSNRLLEYKEQYEFIRIVRGHPTNVLRRFQKCVHVLLAEGYSDRDCIIRVCADSPFTDFQLVSEYIDRFEGRYLQPLWKGKPTSLTYSGLGFELLSLKELRLLHAESTNAEHVTYDIYCNTHGPSLDKLTITDLSFEKYYPMIFDELRLTFDYPDDMLIAKVLLSNYGDSLAMVDCRELVKYCYSDALLSAYMKKQNMRAAPKS